MSGRPQGRSRQPRRERSQRNKGRDHSADSVSSTTSSRSERGDRNGRNSRRRGERKDERGRKPDEKGKDTREKDGAKGNATEKARRLEKPTSRDGKGDPLSRSIQSRDSPRDGSNLKNLDRQNLFADDSRLSHLIRRVTRESDHDRRLTAASQLEEFFSNPDNFQVTIKSADNILSALGDVFYERGFLELKEQVACCTGIVGSLLGFDARRYFQWVFGKLDSASSEDLKILLLMSLAKAVQMDSDSQMFRESIVNVMSNLQNILENVDSADLLRAVLNIVIPIAVDYPYAFAGHFRDTVDILVGWHIDTSQHDSVTRHTSDCLIKLHPYWASDMAFSLTLLSQFLEDMEAYAEELSMLANNEVGKDDMPSPYMSLPKLTALINSLMSQCKFFSLCTIEESSAKTTVFTTVVNGIGSYFTPAKSPSVTPTYLREIIQRVIQCVNMSGYSFYYEKLFVSANECLEVMCSWLQSYFSCCCDLAATFVFQQLQSAIPLPYTHVLSIIRFIHKIVEKVSTAIPVNFVQQLLQPLSPFMKLRFSTDQTVLSSVMEVYQGFLGIPDVPLLEAAYRTVATELKSSSQIMKDTIKKSSGQEETKMQEICSPSDGETNREAQEETNVPELTMEGNKAVEIDVDSSNCSIQETETVIIFDLCALSEIATSKSVVLGLWKLSPTPFELLTQVLSPCDWDVAACFPSIQYTILHTLYTHSQRQHHFLPSSSSGGLLKITEGSSNGDILTIFKLLSKILKNNSTSDDSRRLCFVWLVEVLNHCQTTDALLMVAEYYNFDSLAQDLLPLTFYQNTSTVLDVCQCLQILVNLGLLSNDCLTECLQDCVVRLSDISETVRNSYLELIKSLPTETVTSFATRHLLRSQGVQKESKATGRPITTSCKDMWWVRKSHMIKPPTGSFHSNNFQVIINFILYGVPPGKDIKNDWLLRLFHTCNRPNKYLPSELAHFNRCEALLWFWVTWEAAQFCVLARLRTPLGRAQETFQVIEGILKKYAIEAKNTDDARNQGIKIKLSSDSASNKEDSSSALGPKVYVCPLRSVLLLRFVEDLEKLMYNAFEGCAVGLPSPPKSVKIFFRTNRGTCQEWLTRIREPVMEIGVANGSPAMTVWHGFQTLHDLQAAKNTQGREFEHVVGLVAKALCQLKSAEAVTGLMTWAHSVCGQSFSWMNGTVSKAKGWFEKAAKEYQNVLDESLLSNEEMKGDNSKPQTNNNHLIKPEVAEFLVNEVVDCYTKLSDWNEVDNWQKHISSLRKQTSDVNLQHSLSVNMDMNYVKALGKFEECNFPSVRDYLQLIPGAALNSVTENIAKSPWAPGTQDTTEGPVFNPCWAPEQVAQASQLALMQAETLYWISYASGMTNNKKKDAAGAKDIKVLQAVREFIKQSEIRAVGALRVGILDWPPNISAAQALNIQYAAVLKDAVMPGAQEVTKNSLVFLHGDNTFKADPTQHDCSVLCQAVRFAQHMQHLGIQQTVARDETAKQFSTLQLATARLARKQYNYKLAQTFLVQQLKLLGGSVNVPTNTKNNLVEPLICGLSNLPKSHSVSQVELLKVKRECAKLAFTLGYATEAVGMLCESVAEFSAVGQYNWNISNLNARSLLTLSRWLLVDRKLLGTVTKSNGNGSSSVFSKISALCDIELNYQGCGQSILVPRITGTHDDFPGPEGSSNVAAGVNDLESVCGQLLHLSTMQSPDLGKAWYSLAGWCYRWGRKTVEQASSNGTMELLPNEKAKVQASLPEGMAEVDVDSVLSILGQAHSSAMAVEGEDIGDDEQEYHDGIDVTRKQLLLTCPILQQADTLCLDSLLSVWKGVQDRTFKHYHFAVKAYFMYLRVGDGSSRKLASDKSDGDGQKAYRGSVDDDSNVTATLRLLRLLVKHAGELRTELEEGLASTPTRPWKDITPQLFSRLNHPESYVRQSVSDLLCRVAKDATHLIVFPAVVGCTTALPQFHSRDKDAEGSFIPNLPMWVPNSGDKMFNDEASQPLNQEGAEKPAARCDSDTALQSCFLSIVDSLRSYNPQLISEVQGFIQELRRVTLLWEELWHGSLIQTHQDVTRRQHQLEEEVKRVMHNPNLTVQQKSALIREKHVAIMKPVVFGLEQLQAITSQHAHTPHEQWFQKTYSTVIENALEALRNPTEPTNPKASWEPFKQLLQAFQARSQKRSSYLLRMEEISPYLAKIKSSAIYMPGQTQFSGQVVTIDSIVSEVTILPTKTKPKKIVFIGSDSHRHSFLFKGLEDLHLDERIMQFLSICNNMFARHDSHSSPLFQARHYSVTPLGPKSGLIKWVDGSVPVFALYKRWQQRETAAAALVKTTQGANPPPPQPLRPSEMFYNKMTPALKEKGVTDLSNRKEWPLPVMRQVLEELIAETPKDLLAKELWCSSTGASEWWHLVQCYARSTAVMSMIGYIIGLGDRHLDNMLIDFTTGEVVHIDYNVCFDKGKSLRVPEKVPFRMTPNLQEALGVTGVEGIFRLSCEQVLKILRQGRETLLTLLEAFVYDPLVDWTTANDGAFASAFYGGGAPGAAENKVNKKEMERAVTQSLFSSRVAEMKVNWTANRDEMHASLTNLEECLDVFVSSVTLLKSLDQNAEELKEQQETLQTAVNSPQHPLHSVQAKFDERARLQADHDRVLQSIKEKLSECQHWQKQHQISMETVHGQQLSSLASEVLQPLDLGLPSFAPAVSFLQGAGQGHIVTQSEKLETELSGLLHQRRAVLRSCLDLLHTYATVTSQFPSGFVQYNRSAEWQDWLQVLADDSATNRCHEILKENEKVHSKGKENSGSPSIATITALMSMEVKLQSNLTEQNPKFIKFCERRKQENVETTVLSKAVTEALNSLKQFVSDKRSTALPSLACVVLTAMCALNKRCLVMENTAKVAGERLSELTSREGDWFLDELCSMSGNVTQLLVLLKEYPLVKAPSEATVEKAQEGIKAVLSVHRVFVALQELVSNFRTIIVPEAVKSIHAEDTTVLSMMDKLVQMATTKKFTLKQITSGIDAHLKESTPPEVPSKEDIRNVVEELQDEFDELQQTIPSASAKDTSSAMTAGQMLLAGFNGLFTKVENDLSSLLGLMRNLELDQKDQNLDIVKESQNLSISTTERNTELLFQLFFVKRLEVMISFFVATRLMTLTLRGNSVNENITPSVALETKGVLTLFKMHTINGDVASPNGSQDHWNAEHCFSEEDLASYIKHFIAECVQQRMMGLPSKALAAVVAKYIGILGGDVAKESEAVKDGVVLSEEMCKKVVDWNIKKGAFQAKQMTQVSTLTSAYDVGWRKHDFARRLDNSITVYKGVVQRAQLQLARFQWLYEDNLVRCPMRGNNMISPARATVMADLRKRMQALVQMDTAVKAVEERFVGQESSIEQRLKWAAGANPALNPVLQNFEKSLNNRKKLLLVEVKRSSEICALSNAILHFEALRTYTSDAKSLDNAMIALVKKCEESSGLLEKCVEKLKEVEGVTRKVKVSYPPEAPITSEWMLAKLEYVAGQIASHRSRKMQAISAIGANRDVLKTQGSSLRGVMVSHQQLIGEVKSMLTTMAKDDEAPESQAAKSFIANHNALAEESAQLIKNILNVCSGKIDVDKGVGLPEDAVKDLKENIKTVATFAQWVHDHLYALASPLVSDETGSTSGKTPIVAPPATFASALRQGGPATSGQGNKDGAHTEPGAAVTQVQSHPAILQHEFASPGGTPPTSKLASMVASPRRGSREPFTRDPRTGKAVQERNSYAVGVWRRVKNKLDGRDVDINKRMSVQDQVDYVIRESASLDNLAQMYEGWTAWV